MNLIKILLFSTLLMFTISGCQGTNSDTPETNTTNPVALPDTNTTLPPIDINATTDVKNLTIINGNRVVITGGKTTRDIYIMAFNSSGSTNTEGNITFQYPSEFIDNGTFYGLIDPGTATIVDGRVHFVYTSPDDITEINGTTAQFLFHDTSNSDVNVSLFVDFNLTGDYVSTVPILQTLVLSDDNITIYSDNQVESLTLLAYSDQSTTNITTTLDIKYPDSIINSGIDIGSLPATLNVIDGKVILNYTGTADLAQTITKLNENNITNPIKVNIFDKITGSNVNLNLNFIANANDPKYKNYFLNIYPQPTLSVLQPASSKVLEVYLEDNSTSLPVANEPVLVEFFDSSKGTLNSFSATTDVNGQAVFNYTAPATISSINDFTMIFKLINDVNIAKPLSVEFTPNVALKDYTGYTISLVDANRTITTPSQTEVFDIFLKGADGKAAENEPITIDFFDGNQGTVNAFKGVTDANGHVAFNYTAPATNLTDINATAITFRIENTTISNNSVSSVLTVDTNKANVAKLQLATSSITLSQNAEAVSIDVLAFNGNNEAYSGTGLVTVIYPTEITDDNVSGGQFAQSSVEIVNGKASFSFIGPDPLTSDVGPLNFTFSYSGTSDINTTLSIYYEPDLPKIVVDDGNITVTKNGEVVSISLSVYDKYNSAYEGGNIKIIYPDTVVGSDIGSFDTSSSAVVNGKVNFVYTASNPLDLNGTTLNFKFYHDSEPIRSQKEFTVTINADPNQVVLTNYKLNGIYDSSMSIETTKGMTFFVEDDLGNAISDSNVTSMTISLLNSNLGLLRDSADRNGSSLDFNSTNNVQVNLESKTLSGLIPIQVYTEFKDANNQDKNLTKVFNVVILSGPPTAMSLSYAGTTQESANAKFIENWVLTVTDKYNNLVNTTPSISTGMITGYADANNTSSNAGNYLYFNSSTNDGNLTDVSVAGTDTFTSSREAFSKIDFVNDTLVLFGGTGYVFDTYGKWDIVSSTNTELTLSDDYNGSNATGLGYAVGHNFRNEVCDGSSVVANVYAKDNNNILDTTGSMIIQVEYDYYLVGKSTVLWANLVGQSNGDTVRTGIGKKITLRGNGINGESYDYAKGYEGVVTLSVKITDTVEYYKNTNFDYVVKVTGDDTNWTISSTSMDPGLGITACVNGDGKSTGGVAYVDVNITSPALNAGTVSLENVLVRPEF